jgi:Zn-dependent peptidase ImmA (M78 family)
MIARVGHIITARRQARGLDVAALAEGAGVSVDHLRQLEAGQAGISTVGLEKLAGFLELDLAALRRGEQRDAAEPSVFLRHHDSPDFHPSDWPVLDGALHQGRSLQALGRLLGHVPILAARGAAYGPSPAREGYALARELRTALKLGGESIGDLRALAEEQLQVAVVVRALSSVKVTALSVRADDGATIVLNELDPDRQKNPMLARVHIAHELCHLLYDPSDGGLHLVVDLALDRRDLAAEQRARGFAAELLLPEQGLKALLGPPGATTSRDEAQRRVREARRAFGTPHEIAVNHLTNLGFIDGALREGLLLKAAAVPTVETSLPAPGAPSRRVRALIEQAHSLGLVTDGQARDVLGLDFSAPLPWEIQAA